MANKKEEFPIGTQLLKPDGSMYLYVQASQDFENGTYAELNQLHRLTPFRGGFRFPPMIVCETVPKDSYTFVLIRAPQAKQEKNPSGGILVPNNGGQDN